MAKLDDFLGKKKESTPILDLFRATAKTEEEFRKLYDKLPELKIKPERVRAEELKIREKKFKFKSSKKNLKQKFNFLDPAPSEMGDINIDEIAAVPIDWKMLTLVRPKTKTEEEMFSRLVELRKLSLKTAAKDRRSYGIDPQIKKTKNKAGVVETKIKTCRECGEEFCTGEFCIQFSYDNFARVSEDAIRTSPTKSTASLPKQATKHNSKKILRRSRSTTKSSRSKSRKKSKSPEKSPSKQPIQKGRSKSSLKPLERSKSIEKSILKSPQKTTATTKSTKSVVTIKETKKKSNKKKSKK